MNCDNAHNTDIRVLVVCRRTVAHFLAKRLLFTVWVPQSTLIKIGHFYGNLQRIESHYYIFLKSFGKYLFNFYSYLLWEIQLNNQFLNLMRTLRNIRGGWHWFAVELWSLTNWNQVTSIFIERMKLYEVLISDYDSSIRNKIKFDIILICLHLISIHYFLAGKYFKAKSHCQFCSSILQN